MKYDYSALNGKIVEVFTTQANFAEALGYSERTVSLKLNGHVPWKDIEIYRAINLLGLTVDDIPRYFFKHDVHERELIK